MNGRTYEILADWIAGKHGVTIEFCSPDTTPQANVKDRVIKLPSGVDDVNAYAALQHLMHEAAHINYTRIIPDDISDNDQMRHDILNVIEDVRIDNYNFSRLPNIHEFYRRGMKYEVDKRKEVDMSQVPMERKVLINAIMELEHLSEFKIQDPRADKIIRDTGLLHMIRNGIRAIEQHDWNEVKKTVTEILQKLGLDKMPKQPITRFGHIGGAGKDGDKNKSGSAVQGGQQPAGGDGKSGNSGGDQPGGSQKTGAEDGQDPGSGGGGGDLLDLSGLQTGDEVYTSHGAGHGSSSCNAVLGEIATEELTKNKFKETLQVKETKTILKGNDLNTDNLTAFFTGDVEELFKEDVVEKKSKSKVTIVMDASGSMGTGLMCGMTRKSAVAGCVKNLVDILAEVQAAEGLDVDYEIAGFDSDYYPYSKENWFNEYCANGGGTYMLQAFEKAQDRMLSDVEIDGKRMIVFFTDGDVCHDEIQKMRDRIAKHGADIRAMIIGVGAHVPGPFVDEIVGDNNIIHSKMANQILLESIMTMLEG